MAETRPRTPRSTYRRDPAIYADPSQHDDRLVALQAYRRGCRCDFCAKHMRAERRRWREERGSYQTSPERKREQNRRYWYGLEPHQYDRMFAEQEGYCKVCGEHKGESLVVDHCHATGIVRGLLCSKCNVLLGMAKDDPAILRGAITYLTSATDRR
jgi:hypothetical protein